MRKRSQTEVLDSRPKKRARWAPYVSVPPVDPTWVIEDTWTAVQRALVHSALFEDNEGILYLSHTEVDDDDDAESKSSGLSDLTELTSSDDEEEERRTAEALLPRSEEDESVPQVYGECPTASTSSNVQPRPSVPSMSDSRDKQIKSLRFKKRVQESPLPGSSRDIMPPPPVSDIRSSPYRQPETTLVRLSVEP